MNPELRRNIWLEISTSRLISMAGILFLVFLIPYTGDGALSGRQTGKVASTAVVVFFIISILWGCKLAADALQDEVREHTWDFQKMSPIGAWSMTWGKIFGSTIYTWYGGLICLGVFTIFSLSRFDPAIVIAKVLLMALAALMGQTVAFLSSVEAVIKSRSSDRGMIFASMVTGLAVAGFVFSLSMKVEQAAFDRISWYGFEFSSLRFTVVSCVIFFGWFMTGAYRLMRTELQYSSAPWIWITFMLFQMVYFSGFTGFLSYSLLAERSTAVFGTAFAVAVAWTYIMLASEENTLVRFRKISRCISNRDFRTFSLLAPRWLVNYALAVLAGVLLIAFVSFTATGNALQTLPLSFVTAVTLFVARDILIVLFYNFSGRKKSADRAAIITLFILYMLLPWAVSAMGGGILMNLFYPAGGGVTSFAGMCLPPLIQAGIAGCFVLKRWNENVKAVEQG